MVNAPKMIAQICASDKLSYAEKGFLICVIHNRKYRWRESEFEENHFMKYFEIADLPTDSTIQKVVTSLQKKKIISGYGYVDCISSKLLERLQ